MSNDKNILRICELITNLLNFNTRYFNTQNENLITCTSINIPELLTPYFKNININAVRHTSIDSLNDTTLSHSPTYLSTLTSTVLIKGNCTGYIVVGPFLTGESNPESIKKVMALLGIPITLKPVLNLYYSSLSVVDESKIAYIAECLHHLIISLDTIEESPFSLNKVKHSYQHKSMVFSQDDLGRQNEYFFNLERRYENEQLILEAVKKGDYLTANNILLQSPFLSNFKNLTPRNPIRIFKNYSYTLNTLLKKTCHEKKVPIFDIENIYNLFIVQIEKTNDFMSLKKLNSHMLNEYCLLINELSLQDYSPFVKKIITYIRMYLTQHLTLESIAKVMDASPSKVSRKFAQEVGITLFTYINQLRIEEAIIMMESNDSMTEIAYKIGFNDANYFARVFKKYKNMSPVAYKRSILNLDNKTK